MMLSSFMPPTARYGVVAALGGVLVWFAVAQPQIAGLERDLAKQKQNRAEAARASTERVLATQAGVQELFDRVSSEHQEERKNAQTEYDRRIAAIGRGTVRLSIPARCPASVDANGAIAGPGHPETRAELEPEAGQALTAIVRDGDDAIRDLNACIDKYEGARQKLHDAGLYNPVE